MASYNKPNGSIKNTGAIIVTIVFVILGLIFLLIGYNVRVLSWMKTFGIVILVLLSPVVAFIIYKIIIKKVKDM